MRAKVGVRLKVRARVRAMGEGEGEGGCERAFGAGVELRGREAAARAA